MRGRTKIGRILFDIFCTTVYWFLAIVFVLGLLGLMTGCKNEGVSNELVTIQCQLANGDVVNHEVERRQYVMGRDGTWGYRNRILIFNYSPAIPCMLTR